MDMRALVTKLAKIERTETPVVSVYLDTRWADEHQRDRVRVFLKHELAKARGATSARAADDDLDWIETEGEALVAQARFPEAHGVALFACHARGVREEVAARLPFPNSFVVAETAFLRPLAARLETTPTTLVVFIDTGSARLIPFAVAAGGDEVVLDNEVPDHDSEVGWVQTAHARYQHHIRERRARHFEAVTESLVDLAERHGVERIVVAGAAKNTESFRTLLPPRVAELVVGTVAAARHEAASVIVGRAAELIEPLQRRAQQLAVEAVLTESAKGGQAVAGLDEILEAVNRGAVRRLYLLGGFNEAGRRCLDCAALQSGSALLCRLCGSEMKPVELADAMVGRVIAADGTVESVDSHEPLARVGGVAALLRYPL